MKKLRLLYGLDRLPVTLAADDVRLPAVELDAAPLRLNSLPLPLAWDAGEAGHVARMAAVRTWLLAGCGDYNVALRRGISRYLDGIEAHVAQNREMLSVDLARFDGLYRAEDWCWSALRPLPRAWWQQDGIWVHADLAFWNGCAVIAIHPKDFETGVLSTPFQEFWIGETLPVSPFRRAFPKSPEGISLTA
jgi:hypothetical protein